MTKLFLTTKCPVTDFLFFLFISLFLFVPSETLALSNYWIGGPGGAGNWNWAANWDPGIPETGGMAFIGDSRTGDNWSAEVSYTVTAAYPSLEPYVPAGVNITARGSNTVELYHSAGTLTIDGEFNSLVITAFDEGTAAYYLSGSGILVEKGYEVKVATGYAGTGYFDQSGGIFQLNAALYIGDGEFGNTDSNAYGAYHMTGGAIEGWTDDEDITHYGSITLGEWGAYGEFLQDNGDVTIGELNLARQVGSEGYYVLNSGTLTLVELEGASGRVTIGNSGTGEFEQTGGVHTAAWLTIGSNQLLWNDGAPFASVGGTGVYTLDAPVPGDDSSNLLVTNDLVLGDGGQGTFNHIDGRATVEGNLVLGAVAYSENDLWKLSGTGNYYLDSNGYGSSILTVNGHESIGSTGTGTFEQYGGTHTIMGNLYIGDQETGNGTYKLAGGLLDISAYDDAEEFIAGYTVIGNNGTGVFNQEGGEFLARVLVLGGGPYAGMNPAISTGTYNMSDGILTTERLEVGRDDGKGFFNQTGGAVTTDILSMGDFPGGDGEYAISNNADLQINGDLKIGSNPDGKALFTQKDESIVNVTNTIWVGSGELPADLNGIYDMQGGTLTAGAIEVSQRGRFINTGGAVNVDLTVNHGIMSGTGTYNGDILNYGTIEPGASPGTLTINGNLNMGEDSILNIELGGSLPGQYDLLQVSGNAVLEGLLNVDLFGTYTPNNGDFFDILTANILTTS